MNTVKKNNIEYKFEGNWLENKSDTTKDDKGVPLKFPEARDKPWPNQQLFVMKLTNVQEYLTEKNKFYKYKEPKDCLLCNEKNITVGLFKLNKILWEDGLIHYINIHNIKLSNDFLDYIYTFKSNNKKKLLRLEGELYTKDSLTFIKVDRNQIMIMDALMRHGGYTKKYIDPKNPSIYRYSEHSGLIDFNSSGVDKIIISGRTNRIDKGDDEIYLPKNIPEAFDYEYIFHTHPPTPKPGGRAPQGILYEIPSISDIFHFLDHYNKGETQGSIIVAPEGLYIIRAFDIATDLIKIDEDKFYKEIKKTYYDVQKRGIKLYGQEFTNEYFYSTISQDTEFIVEINKVLNKNELHIEYYPRLKDDNGKWIIDSIYLPVFVIEPKSKSFL
jgi:hypothetical protein